MRVMQLVGELHHVLRAAALVFPARRRCRELEAELAELRPLRHENAELRRFAAVAVASAKSVVHRDAWSRNRL